MQARRAAGFTLVEVLVAMMVMAVLAVMAWQGVDGIVRSRERTDAVMEQALRLNTLVAQWEHDLSNLQDSVSVPGLSFDGATLRLTRQSEEGLQLVAWGLQGKRLVRWSAPPARKAAELQEHWLRSQQLNSLEDASKLPGIDGVSSLQVYFYRGNAWSNAQSTGDQAATAASAASAPTREQLPSGVRLVLAFGEHSLTRDVVLAPRAP